MSEERLQEIKDSVEFQYTLARAKGFDNALLFTNEEEELIEEIERLNGALRTHEILLKSNVLEIERLNNKEEQLIRRLEDLIIVGEQVENEWAVDICKMIIKELKGSSDKE